MSGDLTALRAVATGADAEPTALLHTCRLHALGCTVFGHRAVLEALSRLPHVYADTAHMLQSEQTLAVFAMTARNDVVAFIADRYEGGIGRIWRVGPAFGANLHPDPGIAVPFDPALSQVSDGIGFLPGDHPDLTSDGSRCVLQLARCLRDADSDEVAADKAIRRTVLVLRAFSDNDRGAALFAVHELTTGSVRQSGFRFSAATFRFSGANMLHELHATDPPSGTVWAPRAVDTATDALGL